VPYLQNNQKFHTQDNITVKQQYVTSVLDDLVCTTTPNPNMHKNSKQLTKLGCLPTSASFSLLARRLFH